MLDISIAVIIDIISVVVVIFFIVVIIIVLVVVVVLLVGIVVVVVIFAVNENENHFCCVFSIRLFFFIEMTSLICKHQLRIELFRMKFLAACVLNVCQLYQ